MPMAGLRWAITVAQGHAWAGSVFRQGGFGVTTAAEDIERVRYVGSADDAALNAAVPRFKPDPAAVARFAFDVDHAGRFAVPAVSAHDW